MEAYCVKCREKREMQGTTPGFNKRGTPITSGTCGVCGTKMVRIGKTDAHEGLQAPIQEKKEVRSGKLVIVESPAKAKTIGNYLGKEYKVKASVGHVRDLLRSQLSVDVENDFAPKYRVPNEKRPIVKELKKDVEKAEEVFIATDPDREGEAIAWHLKETTEIEDSRLRRVVFHEITKPAIQESFANPKEIDMDLVNAQQARRILDRLVGYNLTPLLWQKVRGRLSAGRVQSVATRLIVEREREIDAFVPEEYWSVEAEFNPDKSKDTYIAQLSQVDGKEPTLSSKETVDRILKDIEKADYSIGKIKKGERRRNPSAPFITSTLQQQAARQLHFRARRTMMIAQQLYEGIALDGEGQTGLITYMRTDSTNVSPMALNEVRQYIQKQFGESFLPSSARFYRTRAAVAQEAHEAIRPTSVNRTPEKIKSVLSRDQYKLYQLIWKRFVASQMANAVYDTVSIQIDGKGSEHAYVMRASGSKVKFPGFLALYEDARDEDSKEAEKNIRIPDDVFEGQKQNLVGINPQQHFTQPPPRYSEATLIQALEKFGIGRPSTYAPIISTIQARGYVDRDGNKLIPTEIAFTLTDLLVEYFPDVLEVNFTAEMEQDLDDVANGKQDWVTVLKDFYSAFEPRLEHAKEDMPEVNAEPEKVGRDCPKCGHELIIRWGRFGKFISCSNFPECRYTEPYLEKIGVVCPKDGGEIVMRKTRKGRVFYGCENYPECDFTSWKRPVSMACPACKGLLTIKNNRELICADCGNTFSTAILENREELA
ncbi:MAG: DNA topoisomerase [Anaerolinea thermophila]|uniref:DNA topoisomerase 1 n=1 Tax=Anaerolinea thermophila TaxID=167964 RepID=A0A117LGN4_9CHLR|nr:MAG: DNA topoisomerase [Anaerolinea thermophila]